MESRRCPKRVLLLPLSPLFWSHLEGLGLMTAVALSGQDKPYGGHQASGKTPVSSLPTCLVLVLVLAQCVGLLIGLS